MDCVEFCDIQIFYSKQNALIFLVIYTVISNNIILQFPSFEMFLSWRQILW